MDRTSDTCFVFGSVQMHFGSMVTCEIEKGDLRVKCDFLRSQIGIELESADTALIEMPRCFVPIFGLEGQVLDEKEIEQHRRNADQWNAPYMPPAVDRKPEKIGNYRI